MAHLSLSETTVCCDSFLAALFSQTIYDKWKKTKYVMKFNEECKFVSWLLECAESHSSFVDKCKEYAFKAVSVSNAASVTPTTSSLDYSEGNQKKSSLNDSEGNQKPVAATRRTRAKRKAKSTVKDSLQVAADNVVGDKETVQEYFDEGEGEKKRKCSDVSARSNVSSSAKMEVTTGADNTTASSIYDTILSGMSSMKPVIKSQASFKKRTRSNATVNEVVAATTDSSTEERPELDSWCKGFGKNLNSKKDGNDDEKALPASEGSDANAAPSSLPTAADETPRLQVKEEKMDDSLNISNAHNMADTDKQPSENVSTKPQTQDEGVKSLIRFLLTAEIGTDVKVSRLLSDHKTCADVEELIMKMISMCKADPVQVVEASMPRTASSSIFELCILTRTESELVKLTEALLTVDAYKPLFTHLHCRIWSMLFVKVPSMSAQGGSGSSSSKALGIKWILKNKCSAVRFYTAMCRNRNVDGVEQEQGALELCKQLFTPGEGLSPHTLYYLLCVACTWPRLLMHPSIDSIRTTANDVPLRVSMILLWKHLCKFRYLGVGRVTKEQILTCISALCGWKAQEMLSLKPLVHIYRRILHLSCSRNTNIFISMDQRGGYSITQQAAPWFYIFDLLLQPAANTSIDSQSDDSTAADLSPPAAPNSGNLWRTCILDWLFKDFIKREITRGICDSVSIFGLALMSRLPRIVPLDPLDTEGIAAARACVQSLGALLEKLNGRNKLTPHIILAIQGYEQSLGAHFTHKYIGSWVRKQMEMLQPKPLPPWLEPIVMPLYVSDDGGRQTSRAPAPAAIPAPAYRQYNGPNTSAATDDTSATTDNTTATTDNTSADIDNTKAAIDNTSATIDNASATTDNTSAMTDNTNATTDSTNAAKDTTSATTDNTSAITDNTSATTDNTSNTADTNGDATNNSDSITGNTNGAHNTKDSSSVTETSDKSAQPNDAANITNVAAGRDSESRVECEAVDGGSTVVQDVKMDTSSAKYRAALEAAPSLSLQELLESSSEDEGDTESERGEVAESESTRRRTKPTLNGHASETDEEHLVIDA